MFFLGISIFAAVVLVGIAIRRLPDLRPSRIGLEINPPRSIMTPVSPLGRWWQRVSAFASRLWFNPARAIMSSRTPSVALLRQTLHRTENKVSIESVFHEETLTTAYPLSASTASESPATQEFWQESAPKPLNTYELPTQGLITRRGEAQKLAQVLMTQADAAFRKKDYKVAEKYYLQSAVKDPDNPRIYSRLGVIYLQTRNYRDAVEAFRGAIKFDDRVASRHYNLSLAYLGKRDYRLAEKGLREAIRLDPTNDKYRKTLVAVGDQKS